MFPVPSARLLAFPRLRQPQWKHLSRIILRRNIQNIECVSSLSFVFTTIDSTGGCCPAPPHQACITNFVFSAQLSTSFNSTKPFKLVQSTTRRGDTTSFLHRLHMMSIPVSQAVSRLTSTCIQRFQNNTNFHLFFSEMSGFIVHKFGDVDWNKYSVLSMTFRLRKKCRRNVANGSELGRNWPNIPFRRRMT